MKNVAIGRRRPALFTYFCGHNNYDDDEEETWNNLLNEDNDNNEETKLDFDNDTV